MSQGCWTCRNRKVRCDLALPTCSNCAKAKRECLGYGFRLAWPTKGDQRRSMVYEPRPAHEKMDEDRTADKPGFVNVSSNDVDMFFHWSQSGRNHEAGPVKSAQYTNEQLLAYRYIESLPMSQPVSWNTFDERGRPLLNYYMQAGAHMFASNQGDVLAPILLKIGVSDSSVSSTAVLHAILGLSSSHMGRHEEALAYRGSAVSLLSSSLEAGTGEKVAFQNIATSMLLCMFEIYYVSYTSRNWALYMCGVKNIILNALTEQSIQDGERIALRDWVHYYEVLARFSLVHWIGEPYRHPMCFEPPKSRLIRTATNGSLQDDFSTVGYSHEILDCISAAFGLAFSSQRAQANSHEQMKQSSELELKLRLVKGDMARHDLGSPSNGQRTTDQLYLLAALIYLNRTGLGYTGEELYHSQLVEEALQLLTNVQAIQVPWPFFIIGCEAKTDQQRRRILQLASRMKRGKKCKRTPWLLQLLERFWGQHDLDTEQVLTYVDKMSTIISASPFLPAFA